MKKAVAVGMAAGLVMGLAGNSNAWLIDTTANVNTNSHNDSSVNVSERSSYNRNTYNQRYDNRQDRSTHAADSYNTTVDSRNLSDNRQDRSIKDSFNTFDSRDMSNHSVDNSMQDMRAYDLSTSESVGGTKRVNSSDIAVSGDIRNSNLGDFNQIYNGTNFSSGVNGSNNTIDTSSVNLTSFGDQLK